MNVDQGKRLATYTLDFDIRSSKGGEFSFMLPEDITVTSLTHDGGQINIPSGSAIDLQLKPSLQNVRIVWEKQHGNSILAKTPKMEFGVPTSNLTVSYSLSRDRWPLHLSGPRIGPALIFYGVLFAIIVGAIGLYFVQRKLNLSIPFGLLTWLLLGLGLSTTFAYGVFPLAILIFGLALREKYLNVSDSKRVLFNSLQVILPLFTVIVALSFAGAIATGLLSTPDMKVVGNGSSSYFFTWFSDRSVAGILPTATVFSVPVLVFRLLMLAWAAYIAFKVVAWSIWAWRCYTQGGVWNSADIKKKREISSSTEE